MYNESMIPVSIEEFAAYLDGNLTEEEMSRVSTLIDNDSSLQSFADNVQMVDETYANYTESELELPEEIISMDFNIPQLELEEPSFHECADLQVAACADELIDDMNDSLEDTSIDIVDDVDIINTEVTNVDESISDDNNTLSNDDFSAEVDNF